MVSKFPIVGFGQAKLTQERGRGLDVPPPSLINASIAESLHSITYIASHATVIHVAMIHVTVVHSCSHVTSVVSTMMPAVIHCCHVHITTHVHVHAEKVNSWIMFITYKQLVE